MNCVALGPIWTPLIPSTMPTEKVKEFGKQVPMKRLTNRSSSHPLMSCRPPMTLATSPAPLSL